MLKLNMKQGKLHYAWIVMLGCCMIFAVTLGLYCVCAGLFYGPVCAELNIGVGQLSIYFTIQAIVGAVLVPFVNKCFEKIGVRPVLTAAVLLQAVCFGCFSLAKSVMGFYVCAIGLGIAGAFLFNITVPMLINAWFQKKSALQWELPCPVRESVEQYSRPSSMP